MRRCCLVSVLAACGPSVAATAGDMTSSSTDQPEHPETTTSESESTTSISVADTSTAALPCSTEIELTEDIVIDDTTDAAMFECVTRIDGTLTIGPSTALTAPLPLAQLVEVTGTIVITENAALESLDGLESLARLGDDLLVSSNPVLASVAALRGIERAHSVAIADNAVLSDVTLFASAVQFGAIDDESTELQFSDLPALTNLDGLAHVVEPTFITESVSVLLYGNAALVDVSGLSTLLGPQAGLLVEGLPTLEELRFDGVRELRALTLRGNAALASLAGLEDLERLGALEIRGPHALASLTGLDNLTTVEGRLWIGECASDTAEPDASPLASLEGLGALEGVESLRINAQPELATLAGLSQEIVVEELTLRHNTALPESEALDYAATVMPQDLTDICGNEDGTPCGELRCVFPD